MQGAFRIGGDGPLDRLPAKGGVLRDGLRHAAKILAKLGRQLRFQIKLAVRLRALISIVVAQRISAEGGNEAARD